MPGFCAVHFVGVVLSVLRNVFGLPDLFGKSGNSGFLRYARFRGFRSFSDLPGHIPGLTGLFALPVLPALSRLPDLFGMSGGAGIFRSMPVFAGSLRAPPAELSKDTVRKRGGARGCADFPPRQFLQRFRSLRQYKKIPGGRSCGSSEETASPRLRGLPIPAIRSKYEVFRQILCVLGTVNCKMNFLCAGFNREGKS